MTKTKIQWAEEVWNPLTGCTKISKGCDNCYAEVRALQLQINPALNKAKMGNPYRNGFELTLHPHKLDLPLRKRQPTTYFVNSMSDLFHANVPKDFIAQVFQTMNRASRHRFQVLTKRADRLARLAPDLHFSSNIWIGVSVEDADVQHRIDHLRRVQQAHVRWLSLEPLLGPLPELNLKDIDWVVVGGESGPNSRPFDLAWARQIRDQCQAQGVAFFMKQMGSNPIESLSEQAKAQIPSTSKSLVLSLSFKDKKGGDLTEWPVDLQIREYPSKEVSL